MISLEDLCAFIEGNFDFLMVVHKSEVVLHCSHPLVALAGCEKGSFCKGRKLADLLTEESLESFREGMAHALEGTGVTTVFSPTQEPELNIPLRVGHVGLESEKTFLFFGTQVDGLSNSADWEREERVKELSCLYAVGEWIEASASIQDFFAKLPGYLGRGMRFPDKAQVHSVYQGKEYGQKPGGPNTISSRLLVDKEVCGEITVGYSGTDLEFLPEEKKLLDQIVRITSLALERKQLAESLALKQEEEEELNIRLADLERKIEFTAMELEGRQKKLDMVEAYRQTVNQGLEGAKAWMETIYQAIPGDVALIDRHRHLVMSNKEGDFPEGTACHQALFDRDTPCENCRLARILREKTPITMGITHGDRHLEVHAQPIYDDDHNVTGIIEFYRDVTLEKTYEQQLRQADKLASLGQLVSGIGHEINNPNQFIRGNIKIIKQALEDMLPIVDAHIEANPETRIARLPYDFFREHIMTLVEDMAHGSERIKGIVEGLRRFARRDEGLLIDSVCLNTLIEACSRLVHNEVHKHAEIEFDFQVGMPNFTGNSQKIEQVLVNLIVNAAHAMPEETKGLIKVKTWAEEDLACVQVADNGKGMNEKTLKQIFDPFFTTKRAKGGTGLGLPIAYRIVEEHGGTIGVTSTPGEGTVFTIKFPVKPSAESEEGEDQ